jgi:hypothetical protein
MLDPVTFLCATDETLRAPLQRALKGMGAVHIASTLEALDHVDGFERRSIRVLDERHLAADGLRRWLSQARPDARAILLLGHVEEDKLRDLLGRPACRSAVRLDEGLTDELDWDLRLAACCSERTRSPR